MSVIHMESSAPTTRNPSSTRSVLGPDVSKTCNTRRVPNPERVKPAESMRTPMKNVMMGSPNPALTTVS